MEFGMRPIQGGQKYRQALAQTIRAEELGFDSVWFPDYLTYPERTYWPSPLINLAGFATATDDIKLGTSVLQLPLYDPVRLACDIAMLDTISEGRLTLGVGLGYRAEEYEALDIPFEDRGYRMRKYLELLEEIFRGGTVSVSNEYRTLSEFQLPVDPVQKPHPSIYHGGFGDHSIRRAAEYCDGWFPYSPAGMEKVRAGLRQFDEYREDAGRDAVEDFPFLINAFLDEDRSSARQRAKSFLMDTYQTYQDQESPVSSMSGELTDDSFSEWAEDRFAIGTPDDCIDFIERWDDAVGIDHLVVRTYFDGMTARDNREQIELLANQVMPSFG
jgi:alkanesulfonate monooxygenase SsuD/methylene tetrahydromethanopterin reductase-like flavin-dependent oxidoreductase (luciferase family)